MSDHVHLVLYKWGKHESVEHPCYSPMWIVVTERLRSYDPHKGKTWAEREIEFFDDILRPFNGKICWLDPTSMKALFGSQEDLTAFVLAWS